MPRKQKKHHFIYKTTNLTNEKFYVGMHSTDNLEDGYVGSGKRLGYSIRKYGLENHKFEILEFLPSREELKKREAEVVNEEMLKHPLCMNLKFGGEGGWEYVNEHISDDERKRRQSQGAISLNERAKSDENLANKMLTHRSNHFKKLHKEGLIKYDTFVGKSHTEESRKKISESCKHRKGENNSQFGTCWICNDTEVKKIKKEELQFWLVKGWRKGRK